MWRSRWNSINWCTHKYKPTHTHTHTQHLWRTGTLLINTQHLFWPWLQSWSCSKHTHTQNVKHAQILHFSTFTFSRNRNLDICTRFSLTLKWFHHKTIFCVSISPPSMFWIEEYIFSLPAFFCGKLLPPSKNNEQGQNLTQLMHHFFAVFCLYSHGFVFLKCQLTMIASNYSTCWRASQGKDCQDIRPLNS